MVYIVKDVTQFSLQLLKLWPNLEELGWKHFGAALDFSLMGWMGKALHCFSAGGVCACVSVCAPVCICVQPPQDS